MDPREVPSTPLDPVMQEVFALLDRLAVARSPVVLQGETGVGKEVAARYLHDRSPRSQGPFVPVNCAAIPEHLAESELFGYERGAFTGANAARVGLLEAADGGTLFLDEIGELPATTQGRLLRAVDGGRVRPLGTRAERTIDVRLVSATNRDLLDEVHEKRFRKDLAHRVGAVFIHIPPLRDRRVEIPHLARTLLDAERSRMGRRSLQITAEAMARLQAHDWPGNVRELKHVMELAAAMTPPEAIEVGVDDVLLDGCRRVDRDRPCEVTPSPCTTREFQPIELQVRDLIRSQMMLALATTHGNQAEAARLLDMPRRTFAMRMNQFRIDVTTFRRRSSGSPRT
ncbi:MAG: sigma-54-dependent Fis family transcriptional regulator [Kofleriaceae bacterium]|nr:MAG: sigma-54-dependent Fis family transcriptional regulator [Kofleriaceae bacterium]